MGPGFFVRFLALIVLACAPAIAQAHTFGHLYTLPVPFWLYAYGATAALVVSFLIAGYFTTGRPARARATTTRLDDSRLVAALRRVRVAPAIQVFSVFMLLISIATGLFGSPAPLRNFSMTAFWVLFLLGLTYLSTVAGNVYAWLNPWRVMTDRLERLAPGFSRGRVAYPEALDAWPALVLYLGLIAFELAFRGTPHSLGLVLGGYTLLNFAGVWLVGARAWFGCCEVFSVFFSNVARLAPVDAGGDSIHLRAPGAGALDERPAHLVRVVFVLAMLAGTAYDGLHETQTWVSLFWRDPTGWVTALIGGKPLVEYVAAYPWYRAWDLLSLLAAPFAYFTAYALALALAKALTRTRRPLRELLLDFAYTLLPIVLAYHAAHYFTLLGDQGPKIFGLASDPFGYGWDLFGTARRFRAAWLPDLTWVWHVQVLLILAGHIASVILAHRVALRVFPSRAQALASQVPMLALMVGFTVFGLWILAQPLQATIIR